MFVPLNVAFICSDCSVIFDPIAHTDCPICGSRTHTKLDQILFPVEDIEREGPSFYTDADNTTAKGRSLPKGIPLKFLEQGEA